jgi:DNA-binding transcriptional ArsR family regulator
MMPGAISDEIERVLSRSHQSVSPRFKELRDAGLIDKLVVDGVEQRRDTRAGNGAYVHVATTQGKATAKLGLPIRGTGQDVTARRHRGDEMSQAAFRNNNPANLSRLRLEVLQAIAAVS